MAESDKMPKLNLEKESAQLSQAHLDYIRKIEKRNVDRVKDLKKLKWRNVTTGLLLAGGIFGIYCYSMIAVKQEHFLDDFDAPDERVSQHLEKATT